MAGVIQLVNGAMKRIIANVTSAGAADADKLVQLDAGGKFDVSVLPAAALSGSEEFSMTASEDLSAEDLINVWDDAGTPKVRKADATDTTKPAHGFTIGAITSGASGNCSLGDGVMVGQTGLTVGKDYYLSAASPGAITLTPPSSVGNIICRVGWAKSETEFVYLDDNEPIELA